MTRCPSTCFYPMLDSLLSALSAIALDDTVSADGFYIFAVLNAIVYFVIFCTIANMHYREQIAVRSAADGFLATFRLQELAVAAIVLLTCGYAAFLRSPCRYPWSALGGRERRACSLARERCRATRQSRGV